jgi:hypothetical protein
MKTKIYISYSWSPESEAVADIIEADWKTADLEIIRDRNVLRYKDSLREYMRSMSSGDYVLLLINKEYLQSKNCMFEILELYKRPDFKEKILPIILGSAKLNDDDTVADYIDYWQTKADALSERYHKMTNHVNTIELQNRLNLYAKIRNSIDELIHQLSDMLTVYWSGPKQVIYDRIFEHIKFSLPRHTSAQAFNTPATYNPPYNPSPTVTIMPDGSSLVRPADNPINGAYNKLSEEQRSAVSTNAYKLNSKISTFTGSEHEANEIIAMIESQGFMATTYFQNLLRFVTTYQESGRNPTIRKRLEDALKTIKRIF